MGLTKAALRTSSALWAAPLVFVLSWYIAGEEASNSVAHWGHATAVAAFVMPFYAVACATCAAWEAGRLKKAGAYRLAPVRGQAAIALSVLWPVLVLGVAAVGIALLRTRLEVGPAHDWPHLGVLAMCGYLLVAHTLVGFAVGLVLPRWLAPPLVLVGDYLAITMGVTVTNPWWLRDLSGWLWVESDPTTSVHPTSLTTPALWATGVLCAALTAVAVARMRVRRPARSAAAGLAAAVVLGVFAVAAVLPVRDWTGDPPPWPRADPTVCTEAAVSICVYPEAADQLAALGRAADQVLPRLEQAGIARPERLAHLSRAAEPPPGTWPLSIDDRMAEVEIQESVAAAALGWPATACGSGGSGRLLSDYLKLRGWLVATAGITEITAGEDSAHSHGLSSQEAAAVRGVLELPQAEQLAWFERGAELQRTCEPMPLAVES